ncbi:MAG TPA: YdbH domain-containing protein, partial [Stellaceae bacterium]|nr:YdbH domain-containing protein [Stellaceae bacterium]
MRRRSAFGVARRRRRRRLTLLVVCAVLLAGAAALRGRELAAGLARTVLSRAGVVTETLTVRSLGFGGIVFDGVRLGGPTGPSADAVAVDWTLGGLLHGGLAQLRIEGLRLALAIDGGKLAILGLPLAGGGGSGASALPFDRLELAGAQLSFASASFSASAMIDAAVTNAADGGLRGSATIAGTVIPLGDAPIRFTAELPEWQLGTDGRLAAAGAALTLPERGIALFAADVALQPAGEAPSLSLRGELRDSIAPARFPPLAIVLEEKAAANVLVVSGHAQSADRALALTLDGKHDLASGHGVLTIHVAPVVFAATGRQPRDLFPAAASSAPSRVAGSIAASGSVTWGGKNLTTALTFSLDRVGFDGGLAIVDALDGTVAFDSLMPVRATAAQHLTATLRVASLPAGPLDLRFRLPSSDRLLVDAATLGLAGGKLSLTALSLQRDQPLDTALDIKAVDIGAVLTLIGVDGLSGSGALEGRIPVRIDPAGVAISGGLLNA